jgi:hypothetical protein
VYNYAPESKWTQMGKGLTGMAAGDQFGAALSLSGDGRKLAIGTESAGYIQLF